MADDPRVQELLDELLDSGATPEDVCGSCVELLPVVRDRWRQMCRARAELDALFPPALDPGASLPTMAAETPLPAIPGYEVEAVLGLGGMGVVFRARHLRLNRVVAIKMALTGSYAGAHERERFQREAEAVAALRHPNVVQIYDVGDADNRPYFAMEFVEGGSLAQKLAGTPLPAREAAQLLATLAGAAHAAHQSGIVHRDLKPANVLLTTDGTPKVGDFGLARRLSGEAGLTRTGTAVGTPSYMAPEQARGAADAVGPAADVYALGAILYELLTGRPPFRAESGAETIHQLLTQDPVPPSKLNGKVPRDLETICLKCLHKEPARRYAGASELADDLARFLNGETIAARPEGRVARLVRRVRRRPVLSAALATATLSTLALLGGGLWTLSEREATSRAARAEEVALERAANGDLDEMTGYLQKSSWPEAKAALERARGRSGDRGSAELQRRLDRCARELNLGIRLDVICINGSISADGALVFKHSIAEYEEAFRGAGFGQVGDAPEGVAERIAASNIANALVDALDHWAERTSAFNPGHQTWLQAVARAVVKRRPDADPTGWLDRARNPAVWKDEAAFDQLVRDTRFAEQSVPSLLVVAQHWRDLGKNPIPFLQRIQAAHPTDFWANFCLGYLLFHAHDYPEALRYIQAAQAIRKEAGVVYTMLGDTLGKLGRFDDAAEQYRVAVRIDPSPGIHRRLGKVLAMRGRPDEAIEHCRLALPHHPRDAELHTLYGTALLSSNRTGESLVAFQAAVAIDPNRADAHIGMREVYIRQRRPDRASAAWSKALDCKPPLEHKYWYGYAESCLCLGEEDEYRRIRSAMLKTFGATADPYVAERTGRACLLLPASPDELRQAVALADRAVAADRTKYPAGAFPYFLFVKGLADYRQGRFDQVISAMKGDASRALGPAPRLVLAMALHRTGQEAEARKVLALAVPSYDWRVAKIHDQDGCICHVLRREAERLILPNLPAFLEGKHQPRDNDERFALIGVCQSTNRNRELVGLYTDIFTDNPALASDLNGGHRFDAARAASLVGCGQDAAGLGEPERARFRKKARDWLRADLALCKLFLDRDFMKVRDAVRDKLTRWRDSPDLAGLREPAELEKLSANERKECLALWNEIGTETRRTDKTGK